MRRICRLCNEISEIFGGRDDALPSPHPIFIFLVGSVSITRCCKRIGGAWWHMIVSLYEYTHFFLQQFTVTIRMMHLTKAVFCLTVLHFSNYYLQIIVQFSISVFFCFVLCQRIRFSTNPYISAVSHSVRVLLQSCQFRVLITILFVY